jgi:hypothetical protein
MTRQFLKLFTGCVLLCILVVASCRKIDSLDNMKVVNYDAEFALPVFKAKTSLQDILDQFGENTVVQIGEDGLITVFYKGNVAGRSSTDIFDTLNAYNNLPLPIPDTLFPLPFSVPNSIDVDYAILKSGTFEYGFIDTVTTLPGQITVTVTLPEATLNGVPFQYSTTHSGGVTVPQIGPFDLTGYRLTPVDDTIKIHYQAYRHSTGMNEKLGIFFIKLNNFEASYVEGYLGSDIYELERDTIVIDFFGNWTRGDVYFADPKINLKVNNSFGFPVRSKANVLDVFTVNNEILPIESIYLDNIVVDYPSLSEVGQTKTTHFDFNKDNSNIDVILGAGPTAIDYDFDVVANPDSNTTIRGFMTDSSFMNVQVEVELPMYGTASGFEARDTFSIDFDSYQNYDFVEFKVISENGIPLDVGIQIFFADENGIVLDSLFTPNVNVIQAAPVDGTGLPVDISEKTTFTTIEGARLENIKVAKQLYMRSSFSTVNNGQTMVKILSSQQVEVRMGMKIGVGG